MAYLDPTAGARREGAASALSAADLAPDSVAASEIAAGAVGTSELAALAVTKAKALVFISTEQTGTGSPQNVAHGLGVAPTGNVLVSVTESDGNAFDVAEGTHTTTNVVVTVTSGVKFKVMAWA